MIQFFRVVQAPFIELRNQRLEAHPQWRQRIFDTLRFFGKSLPMDQPMFFKRPELLNQNLLRDAGNLVFKLAYAPGAAQ